MGTLADFQEAFVLVAGDLVFVGTAFFVAAAFLLAVWHVITAIVKRNLP